MRRWLPTVGRKGESVSGTVRCLIAFVPIVCRSFHKARAGILGARDDVGIFGAPEHCPGRPARACG
jgi:hypothetical protein